jgi:hypothetical protein
MPLPLAGLCSTPVLMGSLRAPRLPDVGLGALTRWCPPELVDRATEKCGRRERRRRVLPARTVVYFELARCLFPGEGIPPSTSTFSRAMMTWTCIWPAEDSRPI